MIHCSSCGAVFDSKMAYCPYCGATNPEAAEDEYMDSLRSVRQNMNDLKSVARKETIAEAKEAGHFIRKVLIFLLVSALIIAGAVAFHAYREDREDEEKYLWMRDNIPQLDTYYENRQYDELLRFNDDAAEEDVPVWSWKHYRVLYYLEEADLLEQILKKEARGEKPDEDEPAEILLMELELLYAAEYSDLPKEDAAWVAELAGPYLSDLEERYALSEEETAYFMRMAKEEEYIDFEKCREFLASRGQNGNGVTE